ncbi:MAG: nicotinate (nicotinamide) nucleotide adenylyltransferase [Cyclobacteriaceae bacterium]
MDRAIGLFFGSFNPIHTGHLIIASAIAEEANLEKVWLVVTPQNPFKPSKSLLHEFDRFDMVQAAVADNHRLMVSDVEFHLPRPSYTIHTLDHLRTKYPEKKFSLIIGQDNLESFHKWKEPDRILETCNLLVYPRPDAKPNELLLHPAVKMVNAPLMDISATYIRDLVKKKKSIRYLVPEVVAEIISRKGFYLD